MSRRQTVTLKELPTGGWLWLEHGRTYVSALTALRSVKRDARRLASDGGTVATVITWETCSNAGRAIVRLFAAGKL